MLECGKCCSQFITAQNTYAKHAKIPQGIFAFLTPHARSVLNFIYLTIWTIHIEFTSYYVLKVGIEPFPVK